MKNILLLSVLVLASAKKYVTLNDNINFSEVEVEFVKHHLYCYLDKGPCDDVELSYKKVLADAHRELCAHCNEAQKVAGYTFNTEAPILFPEEYKEFKRRYGLQGIYDAFIAAVSPKR